MGPAADAAPHGDAHMAMTTVLRNHQFKDCVQRIQDVEDALANVRQSLIEVWSEVLEPGTTQNCSLHAPSFPQPAAVHQQQDHWSNPTALQDRREGRSLSESHCSTRRAAQASSVQWATDVAAAATYAARECQARTASPWSLRTGRLPKMSSRVPLPSELDLRANGTLAPRLESNEAASMPSTRQPEGKRSVSSGSFSETISNSIYDQVVVCALYAENADAVMLRSATRTDGTDKTSAFARQTTLRRVGSIVDSTDGQVPGKHMEFYYVQSACCSWCRLPVIHPEGKLRITWLMLGCTLMVYEAFAIPFHLAFTTKIEGFAFYASCVVNIYFILDCVMNFFCGYMTNDGHVVIDLKTISARYVKGWFLVDLIACIPWEWFQSTEKFSLAKNAKGVRILKLIQLLRVTRLLRLAKPRSIGNVLDHIIEASQTFSVMAGVLKILAWVFFIGHWAACSWYYVAIHSYDGTSWITALGDSMSSNTSDRYLWCVYFTMTTMTTVGYGDIHPTNMNEVRFAMLLLPVSSVLFAGLMGTLTDLIVSLQSESRHRAAKRRTLIRYMRFRDVRPYLSSRIRQHLLYLWDLKEGYDVYEEEIKTQLAPILRAELCYWLYGRMLDNAPFLAWMTKYPPCTKQLASTVQWLYLEQGDHLFKVGQVNEQMWMLLDGKVKVSVGQTLWEGHEDRLHKRLRSNHTFQLPRQADSIWTKLYNDTKIWFCGIFTKPGDKERRSSSSSDIVDGNLVRTISPWKGKKDADWLEQVTNEVHPVSPYSLDSGASMHDLKPSQSTTLSVRNLLGNFGQFGASMYRDEAEICEATTTPAALTPQGNPIDSEVMKNAKLRLERYDKLMMKVVIYLQRKWRARREYRSSSGKVAEPQKPRSVHHMPSRLVSAPCYFGESCLWVPLEDWDRLPPPRCLYTARCKTRVELLIIRRSCVQAIIHEFTPELLQRFETFREGVVLELARAAQPPESVLGSSLGSRRSERTASRSSKKAGDHDRHVAFQTDQEDEELSAWKMRQTVLDAVAAHQAPSLRPTLSSSPPAPPETMTEAEQLAESGGLETSGHKAAEAKVEKGTVQEAMSPKTQRVAKALPGSVSADTIQ